MTPQQLHQLERYTLRLQQRERLARGFGKAVLLCGSIALVLGWWWSLVSCTGLPQDFPEGKSMETWMHEEDVLNFWPSAGCSKLQRSAGTLARSGSEEADRSVRAPVMAYESEIPKLTEATP